MNKPSEKVHFILVPLTIKVPNNQTIPKQYRHTILSPSYEMLLVNYYPE